MRFLAYPLAPVGALIGLVSGYTFPPAHSYHHLVSLFHLPTCRQGVPDSPFVFDPRLCLSRLFLLTTVVLVSKKAPRQSGISWTPCFDNPNIECGRYETPLDWANEAVGKTSLAVIRYKATSTPRLGSLFMNPGGPGGSGVSAISGGDGEFISNITGGFYDIVSWDPRGVNNTLPRVDCFRTGTDEVNFWAGTIPSTGLEARTNFTTQADLDAFYAQAPEIDSLLLELGQRCNQMSGDKLKYVGTAAVVRDMVALTDLLDGQGAPVNYWGFSYGTVIGAYFVNMFPKRVGRVIIDGVVNPFVWTQQRSVNAWGDAIQDTEKTFDGFCESCATAGPFSCAISGGRTADQIKSWTLSLIDAVYFLRKQGFPIGSSDMRNRIHASMYSPKSWDELAAWLLQVAQAVVSATSKRSVVVDPEVLRWKPAVRRTWLAGRDTSAPIWTGSKLVSGLDRRVLSTTYLRDLGLELSKRTYNDVSFAKRQDSDPAPDYR
ncbi:hypothetical protein FRC02_011716 [Tulasnella sp. 418]|nr:hypothetical protein FRC02_011716 [Tulasnella sp. 418]